MSLRFPRRGGGGRQAAPTTRPISPAEDGGTWAPDSPLTIPDHACCCTAKPMVKVIMPATASRPHPVDLWLCGHHWRVSPPAIIAAGATVYQVGTPDAGTQPDPRAAVAHS